MIHRIPITQKHIDKGVQGDCYKCVLALAIHDVLGACSVGTSNLYLDEMYLGEDRVDSRRIKISSGVLSYQINFDSDKAYCSPAVLIIDNDSKFAYMEGEL